MLLVALVASGLCPPLFKTRSLLGPGPANYYHYTPLYPLWGWSVKFSSHNNYLDLALQTGLLGLGLFLCLVGELGLLAWRLRRRLGLSPGSGFALGYASAALFAWLFLGGLLALERLTRPVLPAP